MNAHETLFDSREHEYKTASWLGVIAIMDAVGGFSEKQTEQVEKQSQPILALCRQIHDKPNEVLDDLRLSIYGQKYVGGHSTFQKIDVLTEDGELTPEFEFAYDLYTDPDWQIILDDNEDFKRLKPIIDELTEFYLSDLEQTAMPRDLIDLVNGLHHNIDFYLSSYDPARQQLSQPTQTP